MVVKKNQIEITKLKNATKKTFLDRFNNRTEMTEDINNKLEDRSIESTQSEWQKIDWEKWQSQSCMGTIAKDKTFI